MLDVNSLVIGESKAAHNFVQLCVILISLSESHYIRKLFRFMSITYSSHAESGCYIEGVFNNTWDISCVHAIGM